MENYDPEEDTYDEHSNVSPCGIYDAGGHIIPERWASYADDVYERLKEVRYES